MCAPLSGVWQGRVGLVGYIGRGFPLGWDAQGISVLPTRARALRSVRPLWFAPAGGPLAYHPFSDPQTGASHCRSRSPKSSPLGAA